MTVVVSVIVSNDQKKVTRKFLEEEGSMVISRSDKHLGAIVQGVVAEFGDHDQVDDVKVVCTMTW